MLTCCATVYVRTSPPDAKVTANGVDISHTHVLDEPLGRADHRIDVTAPGYVSRTVTVKRTRLGPGVVMASFAAATAAAAASGSAGCLLGACLATRAQPAFALYALVGVIAGNPEGAFTLLLHWQQAVFANLLGVGPCVLPMMALGTLVGSWPLLGMWVPVYMFPVANGEVSVVLEREGGHTQRKAGAP